MRCSGFIAFLGLFGGALSAPAPGANYTENNHVLAKLQRQALASLKTAGSNSTSSQSCSLENAAVRKDWIALTPEEKKDYIGAVQCLLTLPSKSDPAFAPGARNRYDDFVAVHINQTLSIHGTGNFLTWHRYMTWAYETALREECGYQGYQPYWNWLDYTDDLTKSPLFDGSDTSMSGDGSYLAHNGSLSGANNIFLPSGNGGGCVTSGPFTNMTVHLGPVAPGMAGLKVNPSPDGPLGYNPRCLSRDLGDYTSSTWFTSENLLNITIGDASSSIELFQNELQGRFADQFLGMHASGHMAVGGEASDLFSSINDPSFWFHHSMVDQVYWIWQALHLDQAATIAGTITILNTPPSRDASTADIINVGVNAPDVTIEDVLDTLGESPLCYIYV
ncbi:fad binding domain-containing protein [Diaporthe amygdali]|uniref:fad binding domain-containing protein n=1 Tax=Phomopsis amygdali TaxID=1214568 RepID=UPI0022FF1390|nr:fad binding domain-containing protein [Diaporthe amygdali]KAJ0122034.1 fad binding domain-containing protein [Diaporthe amygdali]